MRIHPFVLYGYNLLPVKNDDSYWQWMGFIRQASALTHAHDRSVMACHIYGHCLSFLLREPTKQSLREGLQFARAALDYLPEFEHYTRVCDPKIEQLTAEDIKSTGYVVDTLEAAMWCVLTTDTYRDCVPKAVNLGEDTDTVAAVAGGLAGALYGYDAIPKEWLDKLLRREYIEKLCKSAEETWVNINMV